MDTRFVPDAQASWLVYDLGSLVLALPTEYRAAADALASMPRTSLAGVIGGLEATGVAAGAPFALLELGSDDVRVALRGPATVSAGAETVTGLGAQPWLERVVTAVGIVRLTVPGGEWTFSLNRVAAPTPAAETSEITAFPEAERSVPPMPGPPPLGLVAEEDRTIIVQTPRSRAQRSAPPPIPIAPAPGVGAPMTLSLELPDGSRQPFDAVVLVGRAPSAPAGGPATRLVRLEGDGDVSRNHARIAVEGGTVMVTDLGSRNGTVVRIPGHPAQKLRAGEPTPVLVDTVIDFGGGIEVSVREG